MTLERSWYWIARLIDPREENESLLRITTSLEFMPETLILESLDLCFFRASQRSPSRCVIVGAARGPDTLDQTTHALHRVEDAAMALTIEESTMYRFSLLDYAFDRLPDEFSPTAEKFLEPRYGRRPPLTSKQAENVKEWYRLLAGSRNSRAHNTTVEHALNLSIEGLTRHDEFKGVKLYSAYEEICGVLGGREKTRSELGLTEEQRRRIERARRVVAHGGQKSEAHIKKSLPELQGEAVESFRQLLANFLKWASSAGEYQEGNTAISDAQQSAAPPPHTCGSG